MRSNVSPDDVVAVLAACSLEAAWIALLYTLVGSFALGVPGPLTILAFAAAALVGLAYARWAARDERRPFRTPVAILAIAAAMVGWLVPLGSDATRLLEAPMAVLGSHPGGLLLGLAVLRGTAHVKPEDDERIAEIALGPGLGFVAVIWAMLTISRGTQEPATVEAAFAATVTFITAALLSMGLARVVGLRDAGDVGTNRRSWIGVLVAVLAAMLVVAMPLALAAGVPVDHAIRGVLGPIGDLLVPIVSLLLLPLALIGSLFVSLIGALRGSAPDQPALPDLSAGPLGVAWTKALGPSGAEAVILGLVPIVVAIVVAFLLVRRFLGKPIAEEVDRDVIEIRETEGPTGGLRLRLPSIPVARRQPPPRTASEAYLASLRLLGASPGVARHDAETPTEHARRLRSDPIGPDLGRLAADYALVEFGSRELTPAEDRRAVDRWRRLRTIRAKGG